MGGQLPLVGRWDGQSKDLQGKGHMPCPGEGGSPVKPGLSLPLFPTTVGQGTGFPFWRIMGYPALGLSLRGPSPPLAMSGALTADLGTAAAVGGRPLLLESTASVSVCSILRGPE